MCVCVCVPCETEHGHSGCCPTFSILNLHRWASKHHVKLKVIVDTAPSSPSWTCTGWHQNIYIYIYTPCETGHGHSGHCPTFCISNLHIMRNWRSLWILPNLLQLKPARMENINTAHETAWGHCVCSPWHCLLKFSKPPNTVCQLITVSHGHHHVIRDQGQIFSCSKELFGFRNTVFFYV